MLKTLKSLILYFVPVVLVVAPMADVEQPNPIVNRALGT
jgi:hypothetical protein